MTPMTDDVVANNEEERSSAAAPLIVEDDVHVHLSDKFHVKYSHLLSWYLPQLKSSENNVLVSVVVGSTCAHCIIHIGLICLH